ncbi:uncharacterized protein [Physcomitrium patens]|uniref:uncharacterized protein n=1 Tax=Physcomitrium patens TaxID=3218 RepID=UPI003CCDE7ED
MCPLQARGEQATNGRGGLGAAKAIIGGKRQQAWSCGGLDVVKLCRKSRCEADEVESQVKEQFDRRTIRLEVSGRVLVGEFFTVLQGKRVFGKRKIESIRQFIKDAVRAETEPRPVEEAQFRQLAGNQSEGDASQQGPVLPKSPVEWSETPPPSHPQDVDEFQKTMDKLKFSGASPCPILLAICEEEYKATVLELEVLRKKIQDYA